MKPKIFYDNGWWTLNYKDKITQRITSEYSRSYFGLMFLLETLYKINQIQR